jgi:hypothetical protein
MQSAADERQPSPIPADEDQRPSPASHGIAHEPQQSPAASQNASPEIQGGKRRSRRGKVVSAADSPPSKRQRVESQVDGTGLDRRQSTRD